MHASAADVRDARRNTDMSRETVLNVCARRTGIQRKACRRYAQSAGIALSREARGGRGSIEHIAEEIADVEIMLEQMKMLFLCADDVRDVRRRKVERLKVRLDNGT